MTVGDIQYGKSAISTCLLWPHIADRILQDCSKYDFSSQTFLSKETEKQQLKQSFMDHHMN